MRRTTLVAALALTLSMVVAAPATASTARSVPTPQTGTWTYYESLPTPVSICQYAGNQLVASGQYAAYSCRAGTPGQIALWVLPY